LTIQILIGIPINNITIIPDKLKIIEIVPINPIHAKLNIKDPQIKETKEL